MILDKVKFGIERLIHVIFEKIAASRCGQLPVCNSTE